MLPNVFIIGAQKAGTTSLFHWLQQHPDIYAIDEAKDYNSYFIKDGLYQLGKDNYKKIFQGHMGQPVVLAANVNYIFHSFVARRMYEYDKDVKIIVCLRDPVSRAVSSYKYAVQRGLEDLSFHDAIKRELDGESDYSGYERRQKSYVEHGNYYQQICEYKKYFKDEQIHYVVMDEMKSEPDCVVKSVFKFLGVESDYPVDFEVKNETKGGYKSKFINKFISSGSVKNNLLIKLLKAVFPRKTIYRIKVLLISLNKSKNVTSINIDNETVELLKKYYRDDLHRLEWVINKDLSAWYD